jgi:hypothetical protein
MHLAALFTMLEAFENYAGDVTASWVEFWGACMEALASADLRDL